MKDETTSLMSLRNKFRLLYMQYELAVAYNLPHKNWDLRNIL
jgi:hypothetical protein